MVVLMAGANVRTICERSGASPAAAVWNVLNVYIRLKTVPSRPSTGNSSVSKRQKVR
jgi:hypothetical protein